MITAGSVMLVIFGTQAQNLSQNVNVRHCLGQTQSETTRRIYIIVLVLPNLGDICVDRILATGNLYRDNARGLCRNFSQTLLSAALETVKHYGALHDVPPLHD